MIQSSIGNVEKSELHGLLKTGLTCFVIQRGPSQAGKPFASELTLISGRERVGIQVYPYRLFNPIPHPDFLPYKLETLHNEGLFIAVEFFST